MFDSNGNLQSASLSMPAVTLTPADCSPNDRPPAPQNKSIALTGARSVGIDATVPQLGAVVDGHGPRRRIDEHTPCATRSRESFE